MTISKTLSTLSLAGALIAAAVAFSPSDASARPSGGGTSTTNRPFGPGNQTKPKPKPAKPPMRECKVSDRCRG